MVSDQDCLSAEQLALLEITPSFGWPVRLFVS